jgi:hypothetical protein
MHYRFFCANLVDTAVLRESASVKVKS